MPSFMTSPAAPDGTLEALSGNRRLSREAGSLFIFRGGDGHQRQWRDQLEGGPPRPHVSCSLARIFSSPAASSTRAASLNVMPRFFASFSMEWYVDAVR